MDFHEDSSLDPALARVLMLGEGTRPLGRGALKSMGMEQVSEA